MRLMKGPRLRRGASKARIGQLVLVIILICGYAWPFFAQPAESRAAATNPFTGTTWLIDPDANARR